MDQLAPFSFPPAYIGVGYGLPVPGSKPIRTDPKQEYVAGGFGFLQRNIPQVLPWMTDDLTRDFGPAVYDAMHTDPMVGSTFRMLKMAILSHGVEIMPAVEGKPGEASVHPDAELARDICDYCVRITERCKTPVKVFLSQMLDSMRHGNKLAEVVSEAALDGPDAGRAVLKDLKVKPRWTWLFVADVFMTMLGVLAFDPAQGGFVVIPLEKVAVMSFQTENHDPRGTSLYRQPYRFWNLKQSILPEYFKYLTQFAGASVIGFTSPNEDGASRPAIDDKGIPIPGGPQISAQQYMAAALAAWRNGSTAGFPSGAKVEVHGPPGSGEAFLTALRYLDEQIVYGILGSTRDSLESRHGSRADSQTAQDKTGNMIRERREACARLYREQVLKPHVEMNWGRDEADRLTPKVSLGDVEHQDVVKLMEGIAGMIKAGGIVPSQLPAIHAMLGLPPADPKELEDQADGTGQGRPGAAAPPDDETADDEAEAAETDEAAPGGGDGSGSGAADEESDDEAGWHLPKAFLDGTAHEKP